MNDEVSGYTPERDEVSAVSILEPQPVMDFDAAFATDAEHDVTHAAHFAEEAPVPGAHAEHTTPDAHAVPEFLAPAAEHAAMGASSASPSDTADLIEAAERATAAEAARRVEAGTIAEATAPEGPLPQIDDLDEPVDEIEAAAIAHVREADCLAAEGTEAVPDPIEVTPASPEDTADLTEAAAAAEIANAAHTDPGSTQSFEPMTDEMLIDTDSTFDAGTTTQLMWGARSDVGCVRNHNEDSYLVQSPLFAVCDGMGGHAAGEVASSIAVETIAKMSPGTADAARLARAVEAANAAVIEAAINGLGKPGMGCTATCAYIEGNTIAIAHVGDSRAYLLHEGSLVRVTHDHSYVEELVEAGEITADEARVHPNRSVITRALGSDPAMYADHFSLNIEEGDRLILCSDGLSSMIPDGRIEQIATQSSTAQICVDNLVDAALAAGGSDNCTVVVVDVVDDGRLEKLRRGRRRNLMIALTGLLAALLVAVAVTVFSVSGSVYLGVHDGFVSIYSGVPSSILGLKLHWLEDETSVAAADLPQDTQHRLEEGIPQDGMDAAQETVSKYRRQIDENAAKQAASAAAVAQGTHDASAASPDDAPTPDAQEVTD